MQTVKHITWADEGPLLATLDDGRQMAMHRLVGLPGKRIEIGDDFFLDGRTDDERARFDLANLNYATKKAQVRAAIIAEVQQEVKEEVKERQIKKGKVVEAEPATKDRMGNRCETEASFINELLAANKSTTISKLAAKTELTKGRISNHFRYLIKKGFMAEDPKGVFTANR